MENSGEIYNKNKTYVYKDNRIIKLDQHIDEIDEGERLYE